MSGREGTPRRGTRERFPAAVQVALAAAILALWIAGVIHLGAVVVLASALAWAAARELRGRGPLVHSDLAANLASLAYLMCFTADVLVVTRQLLGASMRLLIFLTVLRLLTAGADRERLQLLLISFLAVVAAAASTTEIGFVLPLGIYTVAALHALACRQADRAGARAAPRLAPTIRWAGASLGLGLLLFFLIPHVGTGYFRAGGSIRQELTGFSGRVELGSISRIKKNHDIVMRVRLEEEPPAGVPLRWRGAVLDSYDGRAWSRTRSAVRWLPIRYDGFHLQEPAGLPRLRYEVTLEPIQSTALFVAPDPLRVASDEFFQLGYEGSGALQLAYLRRARVTYRVVSELRESLRAEGALEGAGADYPPEIAADHLQLPPIDPRLAALAADMAGGESDPYRAARRIEAELLSRYTYTLDVQDAGVEDPLGRFLLEKAAGHCEYFATAMAVLCRLRGIPSRLVTGFQRGQHSDLRGTLLVRQSDAHSWVEVFFPGHGWVGFDPTPPATAEASLTWLSRLRRSLEEVEIAWDTWVVGLDLNDQASVLGNLRDGVAAGLTRAAAALGRAARAANSMRGVAWVALGLAALAAVLGAARWTRLAAPAWARRLVRGRGRAADADELLALYRQLLAALKRRGIGRDPHLTPRELARRAADRGCPPGVIEVTDLFCRARYGGRALTEDEGRRAAALLLALRRS